MDFGDWSPCGLSHEASSGPFVPTTAPQKTYCRVCTHRPSEPEAAPAEPKVAPAKPEAAAVKSKDDVEQVLHPNSPHLAAGDLIRRECKRAAMAKALAEAQELLPSASQRRRFAEATSAPITHPQPRPPPGASGEASGLGAQVTRRGDALGAARDDLIQFNEAIARQEATWFVQSVTRESKHRACCAAPESHPLHHLLNDKEEQLARAKAFAKNKLTVS